MSPSRGHSGSRRSRRSAGKSDNKDSGDGYRSRFFKYDSTSEGLREEEYDGGYVLRQRIFMALVVGVLGLGLWIVATSMDGQGHSQISLLNMSDPARPYTVLVREVPKTRREIAERLSSIPQLKSLAGEHGMFVANVGGGKVGLCVGSFADKESPAVEELCQRFREFECDGKLPFKTARIHNISE